MTSRKTLAALVVITMVSPAAAQFKPSQRSAPFQGGFMECGIVSMKDVDGGKDFDPIYKIMISLELESDAGDRGSMQDGVCGPSPCLCMLPMGGGCRDVPPITIWLDLQLQRQFQSQRYT